LLFIRYLKGLSQRVKVAHTLLFALTRASLMAVLGVVAVLIGTAFTGLQQSLWMLLGSIYVVVGLLYLGGGTSWFLALVNRVLPRINRVPGGPGLGVVFGLNVPACAAPLLAVLLGDAAARGATDGAVIFGASTLMVFGLAFSAPLLFIVLTVRGRRWLEHLTRLAGRMPRWTGAIMVLLGVWTFWLALA
jgi:cytochrome c-type biogenesis protein